MEIRSALGDLLATAHQPAAEVRTMGDYERAQTIVAIEAEIATWRFGRDLMSGWLITSGRRSGD